MQFRLDEFLRGTHGLPAELVEQRPRGAAADLVVDNLVSWFSKDEPITAVPETVHVKAKR